MRDPYPLFKPFVGQKLTCVSVGCLRYTRGDYLKVGRISGGYIVPKGKPSVRLLPTFKIWQAS